MSKFVWHTSALGRRPGHVDETSDPAEIRFLRSVRYVTEVADEPIADAGPADDTDDESVADERPRRKKRVAATTPETEETDEWLSASVAD